jgi:hypothetical protein
MGLQELDRHQRTGPFRPKGLSRNKFHPKCSTRPLGSDCDRTGRYVGEVVVADLTANKATVYRVADSLKALDPGGRLEKRTISVSFGMSA